MTQRLYIIMNLPAKSPHYFVAQVTQLLSYVQYLLLLISYHE